MDYKARVTVLYVEPAGERGGAETVLYNLLRHLDRNRFRPLVAFLAEGSFVDEVRALGVPTAVFPVRRGRDPIATGWAVAGMVRLAIDWEVDLVHSFGEKAHVYGGLAAALARRPEVWTCHGMPGEEFARSLLGRVFGWIPTRATVGVSHAVCAAAKTWYPRLPAARCIYPGLDLAAISPPPDREAVRRDLGLAAGHRLVGIVGRLQPWKGQHVFLEAAARLARSLPQARFAVVGDTLFGFDADYRQELHRLVERRGIADRVIFTGHRADALRLMGAMDAVVHASLDPEPFGLVVVEAMALARPVIAADAGGPREIVVPGETGLLVPPGDASALAAAIRTLLAQPDRGDAMGAAGRARAERLFDVRTMVSAMEGIYAELLPPGVA
ncbi:MAG: glycosyltransferase [Chloroflexi bacterium]|nr:glycosyltransferase [Chloroflexota bacterium]